MTDDGHISDHDLERFVLGTITDETELAPLEEHLLVCAECIHRAEQTRQYIGTMKAALARLTN
jgi:anti-sigma factor RsiW